ncbi:MAG: ABC transporter substrate-binding protein, partial [Thermoplasmata archaeon]|nr:ABC transporter substrate-binding protein [Thermoplasmata archaeon]
MAPNGADNVDNANENSPVSAGISWTPINDANTFVYTNIAEPDSLDPAIDYEAGGNEVLQNVYETLVWYNGDSATDLVPLLATEVPTIANGRISPDGTMYNFTLRKGIKFHDGTDLTTADVLYSMQRMAALDEPGNPG